MGDGHGAEDPGGRRLRKPYSEEPLGHGWTCGRITQDRKIQREGLGAYDGLELYFETKHNCAEKFTIGSMVRGGSEARPASE